MTTYLEDELSRLLQETPDVDGIFLASPDGLLIAAVVLDHLEPDVVAAMASAACGLMSQITVLLGLGTSQVTYAQGQHGWAAIRPIVSSAILVVQGGPGRGVGSVQLATGRLVSRIEQILGAGSRG